MTSKRGQIPNEIDGLAIRIDAASDEGDLVALAHLDECCAEHLRSSQGARTPVLWYYRANIQAALRPAQDVRSWSWRQPHREREILFLRRARNDVGFEELSWIVRAQITTNLGNSLNHLGRSVEALSLYDTVLAQVPRFAMAAGNRGQARMDLARSLHDDGHASLLLLGAHDDLRTAAGVDAIWDAPYVGVREGFFAVSERISTMIDVDEIRSFDLDNHSLGRSKRERAYRQWALNHQLFLNPLNVLGRQAIAATDRFGLPDYRSPIGDPPQFIAWFNQLKQEYAMARLLLFEAEEGKARHFADHELMLVDTLDYPAFGVGLEKLRLAFRAAYGLLEKVAGFVNAYFKLGEKPERVNLRNVWLAKDGRSIRPEFAEQPNWSLRGLYWLAFDIVGSEPAEPDAIAPEAAELNRLRNALEHRCLILREFDAGNPSGVLETCTVDTFRARTFTMVRLARAALIYLSLAVGREEQLRSESDRGLAMPMSLPTYPGRPGL